MCGCVLNRLDSLVRDPHVDQQERLRSLKLGRYYFQTASRRIRRSLDDLWITTTKRPRGSRTCCSRSNDAFALAS